MATKRKIDYETILACKQGDSDALNRVVVHYDKQITAAASKTIIDEKGSKVVTVDPEVKQNIQQALMLQIFLKYDHLYGPTDSKKRRAYSIWGFPHMLQVSVDLTV